MKIKVQIVERDADGKIISESPAGKQAIITNEQTDQTEVIANQEIEIDRLTWARDLGIFQVQISLGGRDASNIFRSDPRYETALVSWSRDQQPELWQLLGIADLNVLDLNTIKSWLHVQGAKERPDQNAISLTAINIWNLPKLESKLLDDTGQVVDDYKKKPK